MGGMEAVVELKKTDPAAVVLVSSGYSDDPVMSDCKRFGFDAALAKPYKFEELSQILASLKK
jgi:DNA-binding NarL/FixJ family response regulator